MNDVPHAMTLPLTLMAVIAPLASVDVLYYHLWKFRLYRAPSAGGEMVTDLLRAALFSVGAYLLASHRFAGAWFWVVGTLFLADFLNNVADVWLEPRSRAPLGGLPRGEYLIHIVGAAFSGAITLGYFVVGWDDRLLPTALVTSVGTLPMWLVLDGWLMAAGGATLLLLELFFMLRWRRTSRTQSKTASLAAA